MLIKNRTKDRPEPIVAMGANDQYTTVDFGAMTKELAKAGQRCR
jgi:malate dehydrogenase (quinone)